MEFNFSKHLQNDHPERLAALEEYIGFTNIVMEATIVSPRYGCRKLGLTSSGILVVRSMNNNFIITAYLPTIDEAMLIARHAGKKVIPPKLYKKILKNVERHPELMFMVS